MPSVYKKIFALGVATAMAMPDSCGVMADPDHIEMQCMKTQRALNKLPTFGIWSTNRRPLQDLARKFLPDKKITQISRSYVLDKKDNGDLGAVISVVPAEEKDEEHRLQTYDYEKKEFARADQQQDASKLRGEILPALWTAIRCKDGNDEDEERHPKIINAKETYLTPGAESARIVLYPDMVVPQLKTKVTAARASASEAMVHAGQPDKLTTAARGLFFFNRRYGRGTSFTKALEKVKDDLPEDVLRQERRPLVVVLSVRRASEHENIIDSVIGATTEKGSLWNEAIFVVDDEDSVANGLNKMVSFLKKQPACAAFSEKVKHIEEQVSERWERLEGSQTHNSPPVVVGGLNEAAEMIRKVLQQK